MRGWPPKPQCNLHRGCAGIIHLTMTWMSSIQTSGLMLAYRKMKSLSQENRSIVILNQEGWAKTLCPTEEKNHCQKNDCTAFCLWLKVATELLKRKWVLNRTKWVMNGMLNEAKIITHYSSFNDYSKIIEWSKKTLLLKSTQSQIVLTRLSNARAWSSSCFLDLSSRAPPLPPSPGVYF